MNDRRALFSSILVPGQVLLPRQVLASNFLAATWFAAPTETVRRLQLEEFAREKLVSFAILPAVKFVSIIRMIRRSHGTCSKVARSNFPPLPTTRRTRNDGR